LAEVVNVDGDSTDRIQTILSAFSALSSVAAAIGSPQREDVRGVAIYLYSGMGLTRKAIERLIILHRIVEG